MSELEASTVGEHPPPYMIFVVVFLFFLTGLLGFLVCHLLKKKGYRCRTGDMDEDGEEEEKGADAEDDDEENQDTVEQILKCIIENEANMEAFNEMLGNRNVCVRHDPRLRKESLGGVPPHHHTVHSGTDHNSCHLCAQVRSKKGRRHSRTPRFKQRPGERAVFSVGRFRVTHTDKKLQNPMVSSGDQLDQSQDSEERKEGGYNLRSMFKDVRPPSESSNGVVGKRRRSLTIFGLRRGSDPDGVKTGEGGGGGGVRFVIQQQPVVMEKLSQAEVDFESRRGVKPENETTGKQMSASVKAPSPKNQNQDSGKDSRPAPAAEDGPSPKSIMKKPSVWTEQNARLCQESILLPPPPSSLPISPPVISGQTSKKMGTTEDQMADPGPLQTSTPIGPVQGTLPSFLPSAQTETYSTSSFPVTQTPPDPGSSPNLELGFGASLALISLGSSPPSSNQIKPLSSVSSLKTPTSPLAITPSSRSSLSEVSQGGFSPELSPSPKLQSGRAASGFTPLASFGRSSPLLVRTPSPALSSKPHATPSSSDRNPSIGSPPHLTLPETSTTRVDLISSPVTVKDQDKERVATPETEVNVAGILKTNNVDLKASPRYSSVPLLPPSPLSPSSPLGDSSRISNVTIVKASPDSSRQFSVFTMMEDKVEKVVEELEKEESVARGSGMEEPHGAKVSPEGQGIQEKDDMMQMEDIRDCKVTQEVKGEEGGKLDKERKI